jgi:hypothetical protein
MPRDLKAHENQKRSKARRDHALARLDLREPSVPRQPANGPTSHAVKARDPATAAAVEAFLRGRQP